MRNAYRGGWLLLSSPSPPPKSWHIPRLRCQVQPFQGPHGNRQRAAVSWADARKRRKKKKRLFFFCGVPRCKRKIRGEAKLFRMFFGRLQPLDKLDKGSLANDMSAQCIPSLDPRWQVRLWAPCHSARIGGSHAISASFSARIPSLLQKKSTVYCRWNEGSDGKTKKNIYNIKRFEKFWRFHVISNLDS